MFIPSPFSILYNDSNYDLLLSNVNISLTNSIYSPMKGQKLFSSISSITNFMFFLLLFIFYFCITYGEKTASNLDYQRFLSSLSNKKSVFWISILFHLILLNITFLILLTLNLAVLLIDNINLFQYHFLTICWGSFLIIDFAFAIGYILGGIKGKFKRFALFFLIYFVSVILLPLLIYLFTHLRAINLKPVFEYDLNNLKTVMMEEKKLIEKHGIRKAGDQMTDKIVDDSRHAIFNCLEKIRDNEDQLKYQLEQRVNEKKMLSALFPVLFYLSICESTSTNDGESFIQFYTFSLQKKQEFTKFCVKKIYPLIPPEPEIKPDLFSMPKVESFINGDEDLFFAQSKSPAFFWEGSLISLFWITVLLIIAYHGYLKKLKDNSNTITNFDIEMKIEEFNYLLTADENLKNQVFNHLTGTGDNSLSIKANDKDIESGNTIYLYQMKKFLNDIHTDTLYRELFREKNITHQKTWRFLIHYAAQKKKIIIMDKSFVGLKIKEVKSIIKEIKRNHVLALYMGDNIYEGEMLGDNLIFSEEDDSIDGIKAIVETVKGNG